VPIFGLSPLDVSLFGVFVGVVLLLPLVAFSFVFDYMLYFFPCFRFVTLVHWLDLPFLISFLA
jgi:hypothetical protein